MDRREKIILERANIIVPKIDESRRHSREKAVFELAELIRHNNREKDEFKKKGDLAI